MCVYVPVDARGFRSPGTEVTGTEGWEFNSGGIIAHAINH